jgi:hypothetical protein
MKKTLPLLLGAGLLLNAGCSNLFSFNNKTTPTSPDPTQITAGQWSSIASETSLVDTCTNFHWTILEVNGATSSGSFTATCVTNLQVSGTASGTLSGTEVAWTADASGTAPGAVACPVALSGTAKYDGTQFRIPFTGTTCLGDVSGTEVLRRN